MPRSKLPGTPKIPILMVLMFVLLAWVMNSFAETCPSFANVPCSAEDSRNLRIAESSFYAAAAGMVVLPIVFGMVMMLFKKGGKMVKGRMVKRR